MALPPSAMPLEHLALTPFKGSIVGAGFPCRGRGQGTAIKDPLEDVSCAPFPPWRGPQDTAGPASSLTVTLRAL